MWIYFYIWDQLILSQSTHDSCKKAPSESHYWYKNNTCVCRARARARVGARTRASLRIAMHDQKPNFLNYQKGCCSRLYKTFDGSGHQAVFGAKSDFVSFSRFCILRIYTIFRYFKRWGKYERAGFAFEAYNISNDTCVQIRLLYRIHWR